MRWRSSTDPAVLTARSYFTAPDYMDVWRAFALNAREMDGSGSIAEAVIDDATRLFGYYTACAEAAEAAP